MSWIFSEEGSLVNLDQVSIIEIFEFEQVDVNGASHCVMAYFELHLDRDGSPCSCLASGTEAYCNSVLSAIALKMHIIPKPVVITNKGQP